MNFFSQWNEMNLLFQIMVLYMTLSIRAKTIILNLHSTVAWFNAGREFQGAEGLKNYPDPQTQAQKLL